MKNETVWDSERPRSGKILYSNVLLMQKTFGNCFQNEKISVTKSYMCRKSYKQYVRFSLLGRLFVRILHTVCKKNSTAGSVRESRVHKQKIR